MLQCWGEIMTTPTRRLENYDVPLPGDRLRWLTSGQAEDGGVPFDEEDIGDSKTVIDLIKKFGIISTDVWIERDK